MKYAAWQSQHPKLTDKFGSTVMIIMTVGEDGKDREMVCLPLRKIPAWLYSINPNKVDPAIRSKVIQYQEECDDVLWRYWTTGSATRASEKHERAARQDSFRRAATIARIDSMKNPALQRLALGEIGIDPAVLGPLDNQPDFFHQ
ncbi:MAG: phage antirepressor N-terminal domain-containing protein [Fluviibacter sp.]